MNPEADFPIQEVAGKGLTDQQKERLKMVDWLIDELGVVMEENKEYGVLQAQWRHTDRINKWMYESPIN